MRRTVKYEIWSSVGGYPANYIESFKVREHAENRVARYERMDRYEVETEGYGFPHGMPKYEIREVK